MLRPYIQPTTGNARRRGSPPPSGVCLPSSLSSRLRDRKSTRLNSSHLVISYAVFCLKKKKTAGAMVGVSAGFLYYEAVHYRVHMNLPGSGLIAWQRRAHFYPHFTNRDRCFRETTPV